MLHTNQRFVSFCISFCKYMNRLSSHQPWNKHTRAHLSEDIRPKRLGAGRWSHPILKSSKNCHINNLHPYYAPSTQTMHSVALSVFLSDYFFHSWTHWMWWGPALPTCWWVSGIWIRGSCAFPVGRRRHVALTRQARRGRGGSQAVIGQLPLRLMRERPVN